MTGRELPPTAVLLSSRNRPALLGDAVDSVLAGTVVPAEVLVYDQSDRPHERLAALDDDPSSPVRYVPMPASSLSHCRNLGLHAATAPVVALLDDDVLVAPEWLERLVGALVNAGDSAVVTGRVDEGEPEVARGFVPSSARAEEPAVYRGRQRVDVLAGGNFAALRETLLAVGAFDERLGPGARWPAAEDNDLGLRLLDRGHAIVYEPTAVVVHRAWRPVDAYVGLRWRYGLGKGGFYAKHARPGGYGLRRLGADCGGRLARLPRNVVVARRRALGDVAYVAGVLAGASRWAVTERGR